MADTKDADKADKKGGRRASFLAIAKRVKQFESVGGDKQLPTEESPNKSTASKPVNLSADIHNVDCDNQTQDGVGGAEIPDIPLRRTSNMRTINSNGGLSSLATLERILAADRLQDSQHPGPLNLNPFKLSSEKRADDQCVDLDQFFNSEDRHLYPVSECSTEWESSLHDVPEQVAPVPSLNHESSSTPNLPHHSEKSPLPTSRHERPSSSDPSAEIPMTPHSPSPYQAPLSPEMIAPSLATTSMTDTSATAISLHTNQTPPLPALQAKGVDNADYLHPVTDEDMEPGSFDLIVPSPQVGVYSLERRSELLFSADHLRVIFSDPIFLYRFTNFVTTYRPSSMPLLNYTLDALKAIRAMDWMNEIIQKSLRPQGIPQHEFFMRGLPELTVNDSLRRKTAAAFEALARDELPAYVTHVWIEIVEVSMRRKITGSMPAHLRDMSEGLAEVFCITDPSRPDNPIVFASEEFHRTTQYGPDYVLGRNCRFLQGPKTNPFSIQRIREKLKQGKEHYETFLNYRRDGLPFMNLLMCTPLLDSMGKVRYYLGAQIDISGLAKDCSGLESLRRLVDQDEEEEKKRAQNMGDRGIDTAAQRDSGADFDEFASHLPVGTARTSSSARPPQAHEKKDGFRLLCEMFSRAELDTTRRFGGRMHRSQQEQVQHLESISNWHKPRVVLHEYDTSPPSSPRRRGGEELTDANGNISITAQPQSPHAPTSPSFSFGSSSVGGGGGGTSTNSARPPAIFENYLVVRPYPSLRILFASPTLRVPGILQSHLMSRIGGSRRIHEELEQAFAMGQSVTAKVKWISGSDLRNAGSNGSMNGHHHHPPPPPHHGYGQGTPSLIPDSGSGSTGSTSGTMMTSGTGMGALSLHDTVGMEGRPRWIHCTPLIGANGRVGVWIVVIIDEDGRAGAGAAAGIMAATIPPPDNRRRRKDMGNAGGFVFGGGGAAAANSTTTTREKGPGSSASSSSLGRQKGMGMGVDMNMDMDMDMEMGMGVGVGVGIGMGMDEMTLNDFASMNRLPEDEELRQHLRDVYEETRRRERGLDGAREWEKGWMKDEGGGEEGGRGGEGLKPPPFSTVFNNKKNNSSNNNNNNSNKSHFATVKEGRRIGKIRRTNSRPSTPDTLRLVGDN